MLLNYVYLSIYNKGIMLKLKRKTVHKELSLDDLLKIKEAEPWRSYRQTAKQTNFLMLFGGSPRVFIKTALEVSWTKERADDFIAEFKLEKLREQLRERHRYDDERMISLLTVATHMRLKFFQAYKGLRRRIEVNQNFARQNGYVRTYFGATRNLIEQLFRGVDDDSLHGARMRNLDNICANTDIQNFEAAIIHCAMARLDEWFMENNMKSRLWNFVHDSIDFYTHKEEAIEVFDKIQEIMKDPLPELKGVPLEVDFSIADINRGESYKHGRSLKAVLKEIM